MNRKHTSGLVAIFVPALVTESCLFSGQDKAAVTDRSKEAEITKLERSIK